MLMGLFKFGAFIKFIPYPVTTGFTSGIAVVLFSTQINDFLGLNLTNIPSDFFAKWNLYFHHLSAVNWETLAVGLLTLAIIIFGLKMEGAARLSGSPYHYYFGGKVCTFRSGDDYLHFRRGGQHLGLAPYAGRNYAGNH